MHTGGGTNGNGGWRKTEGSGFGGGFSSGSGSGGGPPFQIGIGSDFAPRLRRVEDSVLKIETTIESLATKQDMETRPSRAEFWSGIGIIAAIIAISVAIIIAANSV
jgi:hypothetical protein